MRLGVEAALVDGALVPGDVASSRTGVIAGVGLDGGRPRDRRARLRRPAGERLRRRRLPRRRRRRLRRGRRGAARDRRDGVPADVHHVAPRSELVAALGRCPPRARRARASSAPISRARSSPQRGSARTLPAARRDPDPALLERLLDAGPVRLMTLAPELPGALELIDLLQARGVVVSLGHSDATAAEAHAAFDRGVRTVTHLFNAMRPFAHRDPGIAGAALVARTSSCRSIVDGIHLDPDTVRARLAAPPRAAWRSSPTRSPAPGSATAPTASAASRSTSATASPGGPTACSRAAR